MAIKVGDKVRLTGEFLRNTGQHTGRSGISVWTVRAIEGTFVITDEPTSAHDLATWWPDIKPGHPDYESIAWRRFAAGNLQLVKVKK